MLANVSNFFRHNFDQKHTRTQLWNGRIGGGKKRGGVEFCGILGYTIINIFYIIRVTKPKAIENYLTSINKSD